MSEPKDGIGFLRKMVKFVANPATEWSDIGQRQDESQELERSELKAMVERKRRNDFVRKREFDVLRKLRREGLSPEQLAALGNASRGDSENDRPSDGLAGREGGVKAKIDAIERQMVGRDPGQARRAAADGGRRSGSGAAASLDRAEEPTQPLARPQGRIEGGAAPGASGWPSADPSYGAPASQSPIADIYEGLGGFAAAAGATPSPFTSAAPAPSPGFPSRMPAESAEDQRRRRELMADPASRLVRSSAFLGPALPEVTLLSEGPAGWPGFETPAPSPTPPSAPSAATSSGFSAAFSHAPPPAADPADAPRDLGPLEFTLPPLDPPVASPAAARAEPAALRSPFEAGHIAPPQPMPPDDVGGTHDAELDEPVIAFANADYEPCEAHLVALTRAGGPRHDHAETWHVLFDFYRAVGRQSAHEALALAYVAHFGRSAPQFTSLPRAAAQAASQAEAARPHDGASLAAAASASAAAWTSPAHLTVDDIASLAETTERLPLPWTIDWHAVQEVEPHAAAAIQRLLRHWSTQPLTLVWLGGEALLAALGRAAPTGQRQADAAYWMARLEALRLINRPDQFDEAAMDYCMTYEVSPPAWERSRCLVRSGPHAASTLPPTGPPSELEGAHDDASHFASVELIGQLTGDITQTLARLDKQAGKAAVISVNCARLVRVDFPAAGDLLNWVIARQGEQRRVTFTDAHRLVALFFGAMDIDAHARVMVPRS